MRNALFQRAVAPVSQLIEIDLFEDPEGETFRSMNVPGGLKRVVVSTPCRSAKARREVALVAR